MAPNPPSTKRSDAASTLTLSGDQSVSRSPSVLGPSNKGEEIRRTASQEQSQNKIRDNYEDLKGKESGQSGLQDRLFAALFQQILPQGDAASPKPDRGSRKSVKRPDFSLPVMSRNFRRFNARIGIVFVFQNRLIQLFSWRDPTKTLSFLVTVSFCCLDPGLLTILPLAACILFILVPAYTKRHPPPADTLPTGGYEMQGPASTITSKVKPAPEMSKDFFGNMRDLQNSMEDFSVAHDQVIAAVVPLINFSDERLSSTIFLGLFLACCALFLITTFLPWRLLSLLAAWVVVGSGNPVISRFLKDYDKTSIRRRARQAQSWISRWMAEDIALDSAPEKRQVEIFELQRRNEVMWEPWIYSMSPYTPRSPLRFSGDGPRGTRFFEDVKPPRGWEWSNKKWTLDLFSQDWVEERMITAVEVDVGGEQWVYDIDSDAVMDRDSETELPAIAAEWRRRRWVRTVQRPAIRVEIKT